MLEDKELLKDNFIYIQIDSNDLNLEMDAFKEEYEKNIDRTPKLSLSTHFGNILMLISDEYFDG